MALRDQCSSDATTADIVSSTLTKRQNFFLTKSTSFCEPRGPTPSPINFWKNVRTSSSQLELGASLRALLFVSHETLVHALVLFAHWVDPQHSTIVRTQPLAVLQPWDRLHRVSVVVARQRGWSPEIHGLDSGLNDRVQRGWNGKRLFVGVMLEQTHETHEQKTALFFSTSNLPVTVSTVSTLSPPTELLTTHKYLPESSTLASRIINVPDTCLILSSNVTACFLVVPSRNLYHLRMNALVTATFYAYRH